MIDTIKVANLIQTAILAGSKIIQVYNTDFSVENKEDQSPLTLADKKAHETIVESLSELYPDIPVLSEEGTEIPYSERKQWEYFWLVDPLDGTKEFVKRNGEFTVNIALIHRGYPVLGVIYAPIKDCVYFAKKGLGSFMSSNVKEMKLTDDNTVILQAVKLPTTVETTNAVVASRSHMSAETEAYIQKVSEQYGELDITTAGSSLKLCLVAEGKADVYPRFAPTMEWDTAAGQAIVEQSGGKVIVAETGERVQYNKENLLNPSFIVEKKGFKLK